MAPSVPGAIVVALALLAGCGSSGGGPGEPAATPTSHPPTVTTSENLATLADHAGRNLIVSASARNISGDSAHAMMGFLLSSGQVNQLLGDGVEPRTRVPKYDNGAVNVPSPGQDLSSCSGKLLYTSVHRSLLLSMYNPSAFGQLTSAPDQYVARPGRYLLEDVDLMANDAQAASVVAMQRALASCPYGSFSNISATDGTRVLSGLSGPATADDLLVTSSQNDASKPPEISAALAFGSVLVYVDAVGASPQRLLDALSRTLGAQAN